MSYIVLARKYRPQTFDEIFAQDHITTILKNTIELERIAHAYLFTGPRGVGKTSLARIFAKSLNCLIDGPTITPCNTCQNCEEITQGISADVIEIDGASNTGVEDIRDLQKELMYSPANSRYKIYIIDEVHMLSKNAFNALLKTLEEPPENVIFVFATTEPHKVIATIISRCQRFDFKRIPIPEIVRRLQQICAAEKISIDDDALFMIGKKADGSMRDAQSLMDQVLAYGKEHITLIDVLAIFGIVHFDVYFRIMNCIARKDATSIIKLLHEILESGNDVQEFLNGLLDYIRNLMMLSVGIEIEVISENQKKDMRELCHRFSDNDLLFLMTLLIKTKTDIKISNNPILVAEMAFVKLTKLSELTSLQSILDAVKKGGHGRISTASPKLQKKTDEVSESMKQKMDAVKNVIKEEIKEEKPHFSELTMELLEKDYAQILTKVKKEKPMIGTYLEKSKIISVTNNIVHYSATKDLAYQMLNDNKIIISNVLSNHFNLRIKVDFELIKEDKKNDQIANPTLEDIRKESPVLADFIEKTDSIIN